MVKISRVVPKIAYAAGMLGLAVLILFYGSPGATIARSYAAYNGRPVPNVEGKIYRSVNLPYDNTLSPVTATEAREIQDGFIVFAFPTCPFCRNLLPVLADVARAENIPVAYCRIDTYRDRYVYSAEAAAPVQTQPAGEGYAGLLTWLETKPQSQWGKSAFMRPPSSRSGTVSPSRPGNSPTCLVRISHRIVLRRGTTPPRPRWPQRCKAI